MQTVTVVWSLLLLCPVSLAAQRETEPAFPAVEDTLAIALDRSRAPDVAVLVLAGTGGMIAGAFGGGLIGAEIDGDGGLDAAEGAIIGGLMGASLLIPTAVHLANGGRGNLQRSIVTAALVGGAVFGLGWAAESGEIVLAAPLAQLITSLVIERDTGR